MIFARSLLVTRALLSPTKKRTLFSRLSLSEPTIMRSIIYTFDISRRRVKQLAQHNIQHKHFRF
jgi:hypothetical protein